MVLNGVEAELSTAEYFYLTASHHIAKTVTETAASSRRTPGQGYHCRGYADQVRSDAADRYVSGHDDIDGVTNVVLNHQHAAELGIGHLYNLGHRRIAAIKGQEFSSDTIVRWETISDAATKRGISFDTKLVVQLQGDSPSPEVGYSATKSLLATGEKFTALFAFNDISAIGAIRALEKGLRVPADVSVLGLTTLRAGVS